MTCQECQQQLLTEDDPALQSLVVAAHLAECRACQEWQQRLARIESNVPLLPVPSSNAGEKLQRLFLASAPITTEKITVVVRKSSWKPFITIMSGMAAALLLTALGIVLGNMLSRGVHKNEPLVKRPAPDETTQPSPDIKVARNKTLPALILACDLRLAQTTDPGERVDVLSDLAGILHTESKTLAQAGATKELAALAKLYDKVLQSGVPAQARNLPLNLQQAVANPPVAQMFAANVAAFQRDEPLIEKFVAGALLLARENDPLQRAHQCNVLAGMLGKEMQLAANKQESPRTAELGQMLQAVLTDGIADNLSLARSDEPADAPRSREVADLGQNILDAARPLEQAVAQLPPQDQSSMQEVIKGVKKALEDVHKRSQGKGPKIVPKGKKNKK
jgi:hypothetical protein